MSSRKRPLAEISQPNTTPSRYAPSTPHAIRALQQRSGVKTRSARLTKHASTNVVRPDSIRGVLRQFARIAAPATKKRNITPNSVHMDKENLRPKPSDDDDGDNDSILLDKPNFTFAIEETVEEDDSELPVAPTPSVLPDDEDYEQPTITFQNVTRIPLEDKIGQRIPRRSSYASLIHSEPVAGEEIEDEDMDTTIMTERGRRAISEEATRRLSRYSFGSFRMSDFGTELEIRRESNKLQNLDNTRVNEFVSLDEDVRVDEEDPEDFSQLQHSPHTDPDHETIQLPTIGDETFQLEMPSDEIEESDQQQTAARSPSNQIGKADIGSRNSEINEAESSPGASHSDNQISGQQVGSDIAVSILRPSQKKRVKLTQHGVPVPALPKSLIKRVVLDSYKKQSRRLPTLGREHINALEQATEWFFEQAAEDLATYSSHGKRKRRIGAEDVLLLMRRQKVFANIDELHSLAKDWLPKGVLDSIDLPDSL